LGFRFHSERNVGRHTVARYERAVSWSKFGVPPLVGALD
jgi:hypothetical protein